MSLPVIPAQDNGAAVATSTPAGRTMEFLYSDNEYSAK